MKALINTLKPSGYYVLSTLTLIELWTSLIAIHGVCMILGIDSNYSARDHYTPNWLFFVIKKKCVLS
jgi:hypothetical protein